MLVASFTRWMSAGVLSGIGFLIAAAGLYWLSLVDFSAAKGALVLPMIMIGVGAGMPWGLMDGLSVSVAPKERASMASGIFSTTRVAGEGIALAIATAILASLVHTSLERVVPNSGGDIRARVMQATQHLTTGDMAHAEASLPEAGRLALSASYAGAFASLLHVLIVITLLASFATFAFLSRTPAHGGESDAGVDKKRVIDAAMNV